VITHLKLLATLAVQGALPSLCARYQVATGIATDIHFAPTNAIIDCVARGETADLAIITRPALETLAAQGVMRAGSIIDIALSRVGIAVKAGAAKPDVSSVYALKATLLSAKSIAYSRIGASGVFFAELIQRLGIADAVNAKATITSGLTGDVVARGAAELAVQQISELMQVPGLDIVGPLPPGAENTTMFSAGIFCASQQANAAEDLIAALRKPDAEKALVKAGLQQPA
jgi:molybdate transport system substrate-binding protein